jgi:hypothetical protein
MIEHVDEKLLLINFGQPGVDDLTGRTDPPGQRMMTRDKGCPRLEVGILLDLPFGLWK